MAESRPKRIPKENILVLSFLYLPHLDAPFRTLSKSPDVPSFWQRFGQRLWPWSQCRGCCPVCQRGCTRKCKRHISEAKKHMKPCAGLCKTQHELEASWSFSDSSLISSSAFVSLCCRRCNCSARDNLRVWCIHWRIDWPIP